MIAVSFFIFGRRRELWKNWSKMSRTENNMQRELDIPTKGIRNRTGITTIVLGLWRRLLQAIREDSQPHTPYPLLEGELDDPQTQKDPVVSN